MPSLTLVCATKNRPLQVCRRIPSWTRCGIDAVLIVDATTDSSKAATIERCCRENGAGYIRIRPTARDTRSLQWNLGVKLAKTEWILIQADDDDIIAEFDHAQFDRAAEGMDYIWRGQGMGLLYHRRENFLRLGGFPEDMVNSEDIAFSNLVKATSRGGLEGDLYLRLERTEDELVGSGRRAGMLRRISNSFVYSFTFLRYVERSPPETRTDLLFGAFRRPFIWLRHPSIGRGMAIVILPVYAYGMIAGTVWHFIRKATDADFRGSIRAYRAALSRKGSVGGKGGPEMETQTKGNGV